MVASLGGISDKSSTKGSKPLLSDLKSRRRNSMAKAKAAAPLFLRCSGILGLQTRPATWSRGFPTAAKGAAEGVSYKDGHAGLV